MPPEHFQALQRWGSYLLRNPPDFGMGGKTYDVRRIHNPDELQGYVLRTPKTRWIQARKEQSAEVRPIAAFSMPWAHCTSVAVPLARVGQYTTVERLIPGETLHAHYARSIDPLELHASRNATESLVEIAQASATDAEFDAAMNRIHEMSPARLEPLRPFREEYGRYLEKIAKLPQEAYDQVAQLLALGRREGTTTLHFSARNVLIDDARKRFGFIKAIRVSPLDPPQDMEKFARALFIEGDTSVDAERAFAGMRRLMGPNLRGDFDGRFAQVRAKCAQAEANPANA